MDRVWRAPLCGVRSQVAVGRSYISMSERVRGRNVGNGRGDGGSIGQLAFTSPKDKFAGFFTVCSLLFCLEKFVPLLL